MIFAIGPSLFIKYNASCPLTTCMNIHLLKEVVRGYWETINMYIYISEYRRHCIDIYTLPIVVHNNNNKFKL